MSADLSNPGTNTGDAAGDTYTSIENLSGSAFADRLKGDAKCQRADGRSRQRHVRVRIRFR